MDLPRAQRICSLPPSAPHGRAGLTRTRAAHRCRAVSVALLATLAAPPALAQPAPAPQPAPASTDAAPPEEAPVSEATRQEARLHFEKGLTLLREEAWGPALAEFLLSRKLFATRVATNNAAIALRRLQRYDEALEMFETFLRDFTVTQAEQLAAQREIAELRALVGTVDITGAEPGASIVVSGEDRGQYPPVKPIRVAAGPHIVRVSKEGYEPFEIRIDVAGGQTSSVAAKLHKLTRSGRLRVVERTGKTVDVLVDNGLVGRTPWIGTLSVGSHMVTLRGAGKLGTQPTSAPVSSQELTTLSLLAEDLDASLSVTPTPPGASVWINSVNVGNGVWLGRLKAGNHQIEVKSDGFISATRTVTLDKGEREVVELKLERDDDAAIWRKPPKVTMDVSASFMIGPTLGGDISDGCAAGCSRSPALGALVLAHAGYERGSGLGVGGELGALVAVQNVDDRAAGIWPIGADAASTGVASDTLRAAGFLAGATVGYHAGERFPTLLRLGVGVLLGEARDERAGTFKTTAGGSYATDPIVDFPSATYLYIDPEVRVGLSLGEHLELSAGVKLLMLVALSQPKWDTSLELAASTDGIGTYPRESVMGDFVFLASPGVGLRYDY
jgi:hypothetical protein